MSDKYPLHLIHGTGKMLILQVLVAKPKSGSAIQSLLAQKSNETITLTKGAISYTRKRLEKQGYISTLSTSTNDKEVVSQITAKGTKELQRLHKQWECFRNDVDTVLQKEKKEK